MYQSCSKEPTLFDQTSQVSESYMHTGDINDNPINHSMQSSSGRYSQYFASKLNKDFDSPGSANAGQVDSLLLTDATSPLLLFSLHFPHSRFSHNFRFRISCCLQLLSELTLRNLALVFISTPDFAAHTRSLAVSVEKQEESSCCWICAAKLFFARGSWRELTGGRGISRSATERLLPRRRFAADCATLPGLHQLTPRRRPKILFLSAEK